MKYCQRFTLYGDAQVVVTIYVNYGHNPYVVKCNGTIYAKCESPADVDRTIDEIKSEYHASFVPKIFRLNEKDGLQR